MRVFSTLMSWSNEDESWWELRIESLYESFLNSRILVKRGWELMRVEKWEFVWEFSKLACRDQTRMRVDESWEARICMRVFSTIMSWSNGDERGWELMRVKKREFVWEFSKLSCRDQTRMRVDESWEARVCMRVFSTVMSWSNVDESWRSVSHELSQRTF